MASNEVLKFTGRAHHAKKPYGPGMVGGEVVRFHLPTPDKEMS